MWCVSAAPLGGEFPAFVDPLESAIVVLGSASTLSAFAEATDCSAERRVAELHGKECLYTDVDGVLFLVPK